MNGGEVFSGNLPEVFRMFFRDYKGMTVGDGINVFKGKNFIILIDFKTGPIPADFR